MTIDPIGDRMKRYEHASHAVLPPRMPVIIRVDGKAFHTYLRKLEPFNPQVSDAMVAATLALCNEIQGAVLAYTQSDKISILIHTYRTFSSMPWFALDLQKMVSVSAGLASAIVTAESHKIFGQTKPAIFDGRAFVIPETDVSNYFLWRHRDARRNSILAFARTVLGHKAMHGKSTSELVALCEKAGKPWSDLPFRFREGVPVQRVVSFLDSNSPPRNHWAAGTESDSVDTWLHPTEFQRLLRTEGY